MRDNIAGSEEVTLEDGTFQAISRRTAKGKNCSVIRALTWDQSTDRPHGVLGGEIH